MDLFTRKCRSSQRIGEYENTFNAETNSQTSSEEMYQTSICLRASESHTEYDENYTKKNKK